jgi:hypothetical protein
MREQIPARFGEAPVKDVMAAILTQVGEDGMSIGRTLHERAGGSELAIRVCQPSTILIALWSSGG